MNPNILALLGGGFLGLSWLLPGSTWCMALGWLSAFCFVHSVYESRRPYLFLFAGGAVSHLIAFHWLFFTIKTFGGFGLVPALLIYLLFIFGSLSQFLVFVFLFRNLPGFLTRFGLRATVAWTASEIFSVRIFPWHFGHTQLAFSSLVQVADIGGALLVTFLMFWIVEVAFVGFFLRKRSFVQILSPAVFASAILYGQHQIAEIDSIPARPQRLAIVQGNISIQEKHDQNLIGSNILRYAQISAAINGPDTLIIWPETVIMDWIDARTTHVSSEPRLPFFESKNPLLVGALSYESEDRIFNSAFGIQSDGVILPPYHKMILMPFGEYTPFGETFPWIKEINSTAAEFTPGASVKVFRYKMLADSESPYSLNLSPLICYEDTVPSLSREATLAGAELLVNLTNDAWFGETEAPFQHHLIASFRAIENRRYLVRSTNTGYTAVVDPTGRTTSHVAPFAEGTLLANVNLMSYTSIYTRYVGPWFGRILVALAFFGCLVKKVLKDEKP